MTQPGLGGNCQHGLILLLCIPVMMMLLRFSFLPFARDMGADAGVGTGAGLMASVPFNERRTQRFVIDEEEEVGADANIYSTNLGTWKDGKGQTVLQRSPSKVTSLQITSDAASGATTTTKITNSATVRTEETLSQTARPFQIGSQARGWQFVMLSSFFLLYAIVLIRAFKRFQAINRAIMTETTALYSIRSIVANRLLQNDATLMDLPFGTLGKVDASSVTSTFFGTGGGFYPDTKVAGVDMSSYFQKDVENHVEMVAIEAALLDQKLLVNESMVVLGRYAVNLRNNISYGLMEEEGEGGSQQDVLHQLWTLPRKIEERVVSLSATSKDISERADGVDTIEHIANIESWHSVLDNVITMQNARLKRK